MKHITQPLMLSVCFLFASAGAASAANVHNGALNGTGINTKGQPSQTCLSSPTTMSEPGNASSSPGAPFNESKPGNSDLHYAGSQPQNSKNPKSVAQYDVACFQQSQHK